MTLTIDRVTPESVGELITVFMYETAYAGALLGVNTYDQPGVEEGKKATFALMGRAGYAQKLGEIAPDNQYIIERN